MKIITSKRSDKHCEPNYLLITGYFKDDKSKFDSLIVKTSDEVDEDEGDDIFFYGLTEKLVKEAIELGEKTVHDFVITSYRKNF